MAEGFRNTESSVLRVTEGSDARITEGTIVASAALSGQATLLAANEVLLSAVSGASGPATLAATPSLFLGAASAGSVLSGSVDRITEAGSTRVTSWNATRVTEDNTPFNYGLGSMVARPTLVEFLGVPYVNMSGTWKTSEIFVKHNSEWARPLAVYKHTGGQWKRVH